MLRMMGIQNKKSEFCTVPFQDVKIKCKMTFSCVLSYLAFDSKRGWK